MDMQQSDATCWLPAAIGGTAGVEEQLPVMFVVIGDVAMTIDDHASVGKFLACQAYAVGRLAQDMYDADAAMANNDLAFERQFQRDFIILNIALYSQHGCDRL